MRHRLPWLILCLVGLCPPLPLRAQAEPASGGSDEAPEGKGTGDAKDDPEQTGTIERVLQGAGEVTGESARLSSFKKAGAANPPRLKQAEADEDEDDSGLMLLPVLVADPMIGLGIGAAGIFTFRLGDEADTRGSFITGAAQVTTNEQISVAMAHNIVFPKERYYFRGWVKFRLWKEGYWGVGNDTPDEWRRELSFNQFEYVGRFNFAMDEEGWYMGPSLRLNYTWDTNLGGNWPPPAPTADNLQDFGQLGFGMSVVYDTRDILINPYQGSYLALEIIEVPVGFNRNMQMVEFLGDARHYIRPFPKWDQVLALRAHTHVTHGKVPFSSLPTPGRDSFRGHLEGRRRSFSMAGLDVEYRIRWWRWLGSTFFASWGMLWGAPGDKITWDTMPKSLGGGLRVRVQKEQRVNIRVDVSYDFHGDTRFILEAGEAF